uniref:Coagulation factor IX n=1 Tax=Periophthalmus magnuspinnatus TaxID=409849 RepID=A0A3B4AY71_9GOBI
YLCLSIYLSNLLDNMFFIAPAPVTETVFLTTQSAHDVLQRHKRHNTGLLEEVLEGNLERECIEEKCDLEEARETFENDEKTVHFCVVSDGNQCASSPCANQGTCKDFIGYYTCLCGTGFTGRHCEIARRCDVNNGQCMHFCESMGTFGAKCSCALGYTLQENGMDCEPEGNTLYMLSITSTIFYLYIICYFHILSYFYF